MKAVKGQCVMHIKKQVYFITGVAGFIGSNICKEILSNETNILIVGIDNINQYYSRRIKLYRLNELRKYKNFIFFNLSILEGLKLKELVLKYKPTILIHTAAQVGVRNGELFPIRYFNTNVLGTLTLLQACSPSIKHAIVFSSSSVYGNCKNIPFIETEPIYLSTPISTYGSSKAAMEVAVHNFYAKTKIPISIVRPFSVYGPNGRPDMLPMRLLLSARRGTTIEIYSQKTMARDWTYIDDVVHMIVNLAQRPDMFQIINIGSGSPLLLKDVVDAAKNIIKRHGYTLLTVDKTASNIEIQKTWANNKKIQSIVPIKHMMNFEEGFSNTAHFFFSHLDLY